MGIFENIVLGAIGSILATAILYLCSILYRIGYKEDIRFNLDMARTAVYQIQNQHLFPEDYSLVINQIDVLYRCVFDIYRALHPLSLVGNRDAKKLMVTLLYDVISVCERAKFLTVGYSGLDEKEARLTEIHKCFYKYDPLEAQNCSTVIVQLDIIENIINGKTIEESIRDALGNLADQVPVEDLAIDGFINVNSFRQQRDMDMRRKCFTQREFEQLLRH